MNFLLTALVVVSLAQKPPPVAPPEAKADGKPAAIDATPFKDKLSLLTDGKGHYVAFETEAGFDLMFTSADGKLFSKVKVRGGSRHGKEAWSASMWDPRMWLGDGSTASLEMKDPQAGKGTGDTRVFKQVCGKKETQLTLVPAAEAKKVLDGATFVGPLWTRMPDRLLRDDKGTYYLVDRLRTDDPNDRRDFRVFVGQRGSMKQMPLKDIVDDSKGMIMATRNGNLRLVAGGDSKWVNGSKTEALIELDLDRYDTARLIYIDLGPYSGQRLGTPCDDIN